MYKSKTSQIKVLFLLHEQYGHYKTEPAYIEVVRPFLLSGYMKNYENYIYQRKLREKGQINKIVNRLAVSMYEKFIKRSESTERMKSQDINKARNKNTANRLLKSNLLQHYQESILNSVFLDQIRKLYRGYNKKKIEKIYPSVENELFERISSYHPDIIVLTLTGHGENLKGSTLKKIRDNFPYAKIYIQWWDFYEHIPEFLEYEKECLAYSDMVGMGDSYTRYQKIKNKDGIYKDYPNVERLHWHPTVFDPEAYKKLNLEKIYGIAIFGSAENERIKYIEFLKNTYPDNFFHFGSLQDRTRYISKEGYVERLNQTKIFVNTQTYNYRIQFKGKVREALSCGTFILEEDNPETRALVEEGTGVVYFKGMTDLKEKIDYYLNHEDEREEIARKGYEWYHRNYSAEKWVEYILKTLKFI